MGMVIITVHKATDIEKKGLVGKADPYVVLEVNLVSLYELIITKYLYSIKTKSKDPKQWTTTTIQFGTFLGSSKLIPGEKTTKL